MTLAGYGLIGFIVYLLIGKKGVAKAENMFKEELEGETNEKA